MLNWYLGVGAFGIWLVASLLYLRPTIRRWLERTKEKRAAAAARKARK